MMMPVWLFVERIDLSSVDLCVPDLTVAIL